MRKKNAPFINQELLEYINDVFKRMQGITTEQIKFLDSVDRGATTINGGLKYLEAGWLNTKLSSKAIYNGINIGDLKLLKEFLESGVKRETIKTVEINLSKKNHQGLGSSSIAADYDTTYNTMFIEAPDGYDGNLAHVEFNIPASLLREGSENYTLGYNNGGAAGAKEPKQGDLLIGGTSGARAIYLGKTPATGAWSLGNETGALKFRYYSGSTAFSLAENITLSGNTVAVVNGLAVQYTHAMDAILIGNTNINSIPDAFEFYSSILKKGQLFLDASFKKTGIVVQYGLGSNAEFFKDYFTGEPLVEVKAIFKRVGV